MGKDGSVPSSYNSWWWWFSSYNLTPYYIWRVGDQATLAIFPSDLIKLGFPYISLVNDIFCPMDTLWCVVLKWVWVYTSQWNVATWTQMFEEADISPRPCFSLSQAPSPLFAVECQSSAAIHSTQSFHCSFLTCENTVHSHMKMTELNSMYLLL